jgi:hypothetical protein
MYTLKDNGIVEEIVCGNNFGYVLNDKNFFVNTDYKVLLSQTSDIFVACRKMLYNGKIELLYLTDDYRPMSTMFDGIQPDTLIMIVMNLFAAIFEVKNNGFLSSQNIDVSWDKIFVNSSTLKVKLVYVPVNYRVFDSYSEFESELRSSLIKLIYRIMQTSNPMLNQLISDLSNGSLSLFEIYNNSKGSEMYNPDFDDRDKKYNSAVDDKHARENKNSIAKLISINAPSKVEIVLNPDVTVIGKKPDLVDAAITFNNMISRKHCRIERKNDSFYIADEQSSNGTFVNGYRLVAGRLYHINRGDIIRMADSDFKLV